MNESTRLLIEAKRLLEEEVEWCQGTLYKYDEEDNITAVCAVGALSKAFNVEHGYLDPLSDSNYVEARRRLGCAVINLNPTALTIPLFNDDRNTTKEDILMAFKQAIHEAENDE